MTTPQTIITLQQLLMFSDFPSVCARILWTRWGHNHINCLKTVFKPFVAEDKRKPNKNGYYRLQKFVNGNS